MNLRGVVKSRVSLVEYSVSLPSSLRNSTEPSVVNVENMILSTIVPCGSESVLYTSFFSWSICIGKAEPGTVITYEVSRPSSSVVW